MEPLVTQLRKALYARQLPQGGWPFINKSNQMALEPTCLALLALRADTRRHSKILIDSQRPDGGWGSFAGDGESSGLAGLALLTLNSLNTDAEARGRTVRWLLRTRGKEAGWPCRWKFRKRDRHVRFDPSKFGWPWQTGACSWVVPTSFAVLALKKEFPSCKPRKVIRRIRIGVEMLLDRVCPTGGWNAGNGVVYETPMSPHLDATAIALIALQDEPRIETTTRSLTWLEREANDCDGAWSLAWSILALQVWGKPVESLQRRLARLSESDRFQDTATLAAVTLALDCGASRNPFKVAG